jgi:hypothetical protein
VGFQQLLLDLAKELFEGMQEAQGLVAHPLVVNGRLQQIQEPGITHPKAHVRMGSGRVVQDGHWRVAYCTASG